MAKGGRPKKELNKDEFEKLCSIMCTESEICSWFGITDKTLTRWCKDTYGVGFSDAFKIYSVNGRISLRRTQFRLAEKSYAMAIFLGKQYLGQKDNQGIEITGSENKFAEVLDQWQEKRDSEE